MASGSSTVLLHHIAKISDRIAHNVVQFSQQLKEKGIISSEAAGAVMSRTDLSLYDKASQLMQAVETRIKMDSTPDKTFQAFIEILQKEASTEDLAKSLTASYKMDEIAPDQIPEVLDRLSRVKRKWYDFGMGLDIRTSDLDAIRNRCISSRESMAEVIKIWHQGVAKATWRSLARALRGVKETKLADEIERNLSDELDKGAMVVEEGEKAGNKKPEFQDLTIIPIEDHQWYSVGVALKMSKKALKSIEKMHPTLFKRKRAMFRKWLETSHSPTWRALVDALKQVNATAAEQVRTEYGIPSTSAQTESCKLLHVGEDDSGLYGDSSGAGHEQDETEARQLVPSSSALLHEALLNIFKTGLQYVQVGELAQKLYEKGLITSHLESTHLNEAVKQTLQSDPHSFHALMEALRLQLEPVKAGIVRPQIVAKQVHDLTLQLEDLERVYEILLELQRISRSYLDIDALALRLLRGGLVTQDVYDNCTSMAIDLEKVRGLERHLSQRGASRAFIAVLDSFPNTKLFADELLKSLPPPPAAEWKSGEISATGVAFSPQHSEGEIVTSPMPVTKFPQWSSLTRVSADSSESLPEQSTIFEDTPIPKYQTQLFPEATELYKPSSGTSGGKKAVTEVLQTERKSPTLSQFAKKYSVPGRDRSEYTSLKQQTEPLSNHDKTGLASLQKPRSSILAISQDTTPQYVSSFEKQTKYSRPSSAPDGRTIPPVVTPTPEQPSITTSPVEPQTLSSMPQNSRQKPITSPVVAIEMGSKITDEILSNKQRVNSPPRQQMISSPVLTDVTRDLSSSSASYQSAEDIDESWLISKPHSYNMPGGMKTLPISEAKPPWPGGEAVSKSVTAPVKEFDSGVASVSTVASVHSRGIDREDQFRQAVTTGDADWTDSLLNSGHINVDMVLADGRTALMVAASEGHGSVVKILLQHKASVEARDKDGTTPLHLAARHGNYEVCKYLVGAFSDVNAVANNGTPMLLTPASKGFSMITELLLESGANPNLADKSGNTPLIAAATRDQKDVVKVLLHHGADVTAVSKETSRTALQEAVHCNHGDIVSMLVKAESLAAEKSHQLFTCKTPEEVSRLRKEGAKVDVQRGDKATPLMVHAENGNKEVVQQLISYDANVDTQDEHGLSALMKASEKGDLDMIQTLVAARAILDLKSKKSWTALMYAVNSKHTRVVKEMLLAGADASARDKHGKTVIEMAKELEAREIVDLLNRQTTMADTNDPFIHLLSGYLEKTKSPAASPQPGRRKKKTSEATLKKEAPKSLKTSDETSTLKDQLSKAWKRIADLETRIHDLTLQLTMETPAETDLSYFDRGRLEAEFRKLKDLKKKAEQYAVEAKQTAQRLSAENFKFKEDLSRERHHNELTRKSMLREMEMKVDKSATSLDRAEAKLQVFDQELQQRALQLIRKMPRPSLAVQLPRVDFQPSQVRDFILKHSVRANFLQLGVAGLPFSGKSTLLRNILELKSTEKYARSGLGEDYNELSVHEAVMMKDKINDDCRWIKSTKDDAEVLAIGAALAQVCARSHQFPSFMSDTTEAMPSEMGHLFGDTEIDSHFREAFHSLRSLWSDLEMRGDLQTLTTASLTFMNCWDVGVNKAVFEVLAVLAPMCRNLLLLNVLNLERDTKHLFEPPNLGEESLYRGRYTARGDDQMVMKLQTSLYYYLRNITAVSGAHDRPLNLALLVGTFADTLIESEVKENKTQVLKGVKTRADEMGIAEATCPGMITVNARDEKDVLKIRAALERMIEENGRFEEEVPLAWIFLRCALYRMKKLFMLKTKLLEIAKKCGLKEAEELEKWLELFQNCGSIIYLARGRFLTPHEYVVLDPVTFIIGLDKLYYLDQQRDLKEFLGHIQKTKQGFLSRSLANHLWSEDSECYLEILHCLGIITPVDGLLDEVDFDSHGNYFMPTLRPRFFPSQLTPESESLIVLFSSEVPYHKQTEFITHLKREFKKQVVFIPEDYYNDLHFKWTDHETDVSTHFHVSFMGEHAEISVVTPPEGVQNPFSLPNLCSLLKTACIHVFSSITDEHRLAIVCPHSKERPHFLRFHALLNTPEQICGECKEHVVITEGQRSFWVQSTYLGPLSQVLMPEDTLSSSEVAEITQLLAHFSYDQIQHLALTLGLSLSEITTREAYCSGPEELLCVLLMEWKRRSVVNLKRKLARALLDCQEFEAAIKVDPTCAVYPIARIQPLKDAELATVAAHVTDWMALGYNLGVQEADMQEILRSHRTQSEQAFHMLAHWDDWCTQSGYDSRGELVEMLNRLGYESLSSFLDIGGKEFMLK